MLNRSMLAAALLMSNAYNQLSSRITPARMPAGARRNNGVNLFRPGNGKNYPFSSTRQDERIARTQVMRTLYNGHTVMQTLPAHQRGVRTATEVQP